MNSLTLTRAQAAALCGLSPSGFDNWVRRGVVPPAIMGTRRWSRVQLERALAGQTWVPPEIGAEPRDEGESAFEAWRMQEGERDKHRPLHDLNQREERTLRMLVGLGTSNGRDIDGAGEATFRALLKKGLAVRNKDGWAPSAEGRAEVERSDVWRNWHMRGA